jgi:serine/threonine protein kinase
LDGTEYEGDFKATLDPEAEAEVEIVKSIDHPSLVKTFDIFRDSDKKRVYMVMEYVPGGELFARVANESGSLVKEGDAIRVARDLLSAVSYLHSLNIVHRDIKLENILCVSEDVTKPIRIKLADFGLSSKLTGKEQSLQSLVGTSFYLAPEIITKQGYGASVDAWAIGVVFYIVVGLLLRLHIVSPSLPQLKFQLCLSFSPLRVAFLASVHLPMFRSLYLIITAIRPVSVLRGLR